MSPVSVGLLAAFLAGAGVYLIYTSSGARGRGRVSRGRRRGIAPSVWLTQAGLGEVSGAEFGAAVGVLLVLGGAASYVLFGGLLPPIVGAVLAATIPIGVYRGRRRNALAQASQAWPRLLEELRLLTGSQGRSIPQALFEVGRRAPPEAGVAGRLRRGRAGVAADHRLPPDGRPAQGTVGRPDRRRGRRDPGRGPRGRRR